MTKPTVQVSFSIDTEEDMWEPVRGPRDCTNIRAMPEFARFLCGLGLKPTWFAAWTVATDDWARGWLRELEQDPDHEVGAHLHPWNTPPEGEPLTPRNTMLKNLPGDLVQLKLERLTDALESATGRRPTSFRAGRFGLGPEVVAALCAQGYRVDSSVVSNVSWAAYGDGPSFVGAPMRPYRLGPGTPVSRPTPGGPLVEVPVSAGFTRRGLPIWRTAQRAAHRAGIGQSRWTGLLWRTQLVRRVILSPELYEAADILRAARCLAADGVRHLVFYVHSQSLTPGFTPFVPDAVSLATLRARIAEIVSGLNAFCVPEPATISGIGHSLG